MRIRAGNRGQSDRDAALQAQQCLEHAVGRLNLGFKASQQADLALAAKPVGEAAFAVAREFRHLGLLFRVGGGVTLSRDKSRKIQNLFRFAFRRARRRWKKVLDPAAKARALVRWRPKASHKGYAMWRSLTIT